MASFIFRTVLFLALFALGLFRLAIPAHAADFVVTHTGDSGEGSLRQAIINANAAAGADTISFQAGLTGTITLLSNLPEITEELEIIGPGAASMTIVGPELIAFSSSKGNFALGIHGLTMTGLISGVVTVDKSVTLTDVVLNEMTDRAIDIEDGSLDMSNVTVADNVGALAVYTWYAPVTMTDSSIIGSANTGLRVWGGSATIRNSKFLNNLGFSGLGSSIVFTGTTPIEIIDSTFSGNSSAGNVGAISLSGAFPIWATISGTTFSENTGPFVGVLDLDTTAGSIITITNSTFSANAATDSSGVEAIRAGGQTALNLAFSTFSGHDGAEDSSGGVVQAVNDAKVVMTASIIANNPTNGTPRECSAYSPASFSGSGNLTNDALCPGYIGAPTGVDPALADNGGSTLTHALLADSSAIDAYDGDLCPASDQRGQARPAVHSDCDLGALESGPLIGTVTSVSINPTSHSLAEGKDVDLTLTRTGDIDAPLIVTLELSAADGTTVADYLLTGGNISGQSGTVTVEFPAGVETVVLNIAALIDAAGAEPDNFLTLNIPDGTDYDLRGNTSAVIAIPANNFGVLHTEDSGEGSLRQAITNANMDEADNVITFATSADGTIVLSSTLPSLVNNGTLTINGNGESETIISGNDTVRVLELSSGANVTINALTITRGYDSFGGAAIRNSGAALTLMDTTVTGSTAGAGGGILNDFGGVLVMTRTTLSGNTATGIRTGTDQNAVVGGGAIWNSGSVTIMDSALSENHAETYGGALVSRDRGTATIYNTVISGNTAGSSGGIFNTDATLSIINSRLIDNQSGFFGGAVTSGGSGGPETVLYITDSIVSGNTAVEAGGGIYNVGIATITRTTISDNAAVNGDDPFVDGGGIANAGTMIVSDSTISGNSAGGMGGGIYTRKGTLTITDSTIRENTANGWGGGIANDYTVVTLTGSAVYGNTASQSGGGIYTVSERGERNFTMTGSTISNNRGAVAGGGIFSNGPVLIINSTIATNAAERGGALYNTSYDVSPYIDKLTISNTTISGNTASIEGNGLVIVKRNSVVVLNNSILSNGDTDCINQEGGTVETQYSLFSSTATCGATTADGNIIGQNAGLGTLATPTGKPAYYLLLADSPAIDAGSNALVRDGVVTDQTGMERILGVSVDMGSVESSPGPASDASGSN